MNELAEPEVAEAIARAFWRRIYHYRNDYGSELPEKCPVEFVANMTTALMAGDLLAPQEGMVLVPKELANRMYNVLTFYSNTHSYKAPRIGGVLAGCPRGKTPRPDQLAGNALLTLNMWHKELGREPIAPDTMALVPVEPSEEMIEAAINDRTPASAVAAGCWGTAEKERIVNKYKAMIGKAND